MNECKGYSPNRSFIDSFALRAVIEFSNDDIKYRRLKENVIKEAKKLIAYHKADFGESYIEWTIIRQLEKAVYELEQFEKIYNE